MRRRMPRCVQSSYSMRHIVLPFPDDLKAFDRRVTLWVDSLY
jgi:hypothetical protein